MHQFTYLFVEEEVEVFALARRKSAQMFLAWRLVKVADIPMKILLIILGKNIEEG